MWQVKYLHLLFSTDMYFLNVSNEIQKQKTFFWKTIVMQNILLSSCNV